MAVQNKVDSSLTYIVSLNISYIELTIQKQLETTSSTMTKKKTREIENVQNKDIFFYIAKRWDLGIYNIRYIILF